MATTKRNLVVDIQPPTDGLNLLVDENQLGEREAIDINGFEFDEYGALSIPFPDKDLGAFPSSTSCLAAHVFMRTFSDAPQLVVHLNDGSVRYSTNYLSTSGSATWTTIATSQSTSIPFDFCTAFGSLWFVNIIDGLRKWDGSTRTDYASAPKGSSIATWKDTLWITGVPGGTEDRVYQSDPSASPPGSVWPALYFVDVGKGIGSPNVLLYPTSDQLIVFKAHKIYGIYDPIEYSNRIIDDGKGIIDREAITNYRGQLYFLCDQGLAMFYSEGPGPIVSDKISPMFDRAFLYPGSGAQATQARLYTFYNFIGIFLSGYYVTILYYPDLPNKPFIWTEYPTSASWGIVTPSFGGRPQLNMIGTLSPYKLWRRYDTSATGAVEAWWYTRWYDFDDPFSEKVLLEANMIARGQIELAVEKDHVSGSAMGGASSLPVLGKSTDSTTWKESTLYFETYGRAFRFRVAARSSDGVGLSKIQAVQNFQPMANFDLSSRSMYQGAISKIRIRGRRLGDMMK